MKTNTTIRPTPTRPIHRRQPRALQTEGTAPQTRPMPEEERRLYTDFLVLAFYPGMNTHANSSAA
jgi:hypothetical protein